MLRVQTADLISLTTINNLRKFFSCPQRRDDLKYLVYFLIVMVVVALGVGIGVGWAIGHHTFKCDPCECMTTCPPMMLTTGP